MPAPVNAPAEISRGVRPSSRDIDLAILEAAAEIFARHGWAGTSVQQIADAVGYSKAGLLRRFPSKQNLYDKTLTATRELVENLLEQVPPLGEPDRRDVLLRALITTSSAHLGKVKLIIAAMEKSPELPASQPIAQLGLAVIEELSSGAADQVGRVRALLATQLVINAIFLSSDPDLPAGLRLPTHQYHDLAYQIAKGVLGN